MTAWAEVISTAGLVIDVIGAGLLWKFGLPASIDKQGHVHIISEEIDKNEVEQARKYDKRSGIGFALLIIGFALQAISNFI